MAMAGQAQEFVVELFKYASAIGIGIIANPLLEVLKTWLSARSGARTNKSDLLAKLKVALGYFDAYAELLDRAVGAHPASATLREPEMRALVSMRAFDLQPIHDLIEHITRLDLRQSSHSGAGQALTKKCLMLIYAFQHLKTINLVRCRPLLSTAPPIEPPEFAIRDGEIKLIEEAREQHDELKMFVMGPYAEILEIDPNTSAVDLKITTWEVAYRMERAKSRMHLADERFRNALNRANPQEPPED
ncbi:hypothetical protein [Rhizobium ruizarguesonis]|uniref:hypothetical protein n=1 Tax=Rhizobium ruizarguesonis TaxID=2081791 RepID=UPI0010327085|nr:hypothetical protein [Rhizobium ruizarguesonis]TBD81032.1 hypothetical protein ELH11_14575 [Rhizobium ruizarguesonis]TBE12192.1 hypothetical protein ELH09_14655 [Rhizobium ruizarguesonis]WSH32151.1 hypothetical protein U8P70_16500 [Rhizobium ruizarguesonis]